MAWIGEEKNLVIRELKHARFWDADTGSELFSFLTCFHTTTYILLSIFSPLEMISIKIWETPLSWHAKFSFPVAVRVSKTRVLKLPIIKGPSHQGEPLSPLIPWVNPFPSKFSFRKRLFQRKVSYFPWPEMALIWLAFMTVGVLNQAKGDWLLHQRACWISQGRLAFTTEGVLNLPREIDVYNSGHVESPKGDWRLQQRACWISQGRLTCTTAGVLNLPREIGVYNSARVESPKGDWRLQQRACWISQGRLAFTTAGVLNLLSYCICLLNQWLYGFQVSLMASVPLRQF